MRANEYLEFGKRRIRVASLRPHGGLLQGLLGPGRGVVSPCSGAYEDRMSSDERHRDVPARERSREQGIRPRARVKNPAVTMLCE